MRIPFQCERGLRCFAGNVFRRTSSETVAGRRRHLAVAGWHGRPHGATASRRMLSALYGACPGPVRHEKCHSGPVGIRPSSSRMVDTRRPGARNLRRLHEPANGVAALWRPDRARADGRGRSVRRNAMRLRSDDVAGGRGERPKVMGEPGKRFAGSQRMTARATTDSSPTRGRGHRACPP